eukprot:3538133-Prorocentrum_lima.AAC.1
MHGTDIRRKEANKGSKGRRRTRTDQEHMVAKKKPGRSTEDDQSDEYTPERRSTEQSRSQSKGHEKERTREQATNNQNATSDRSNEEYTRQT